MKVFIYSAGFGKTGGITTQIRCYAGELVRRGHEVTIGGLGWPWWEPSADVPGARYVAGLYVPKAAWFGRWGLDSPEWSCARVVRHVRASRYDIVHCLGWNVTNVNILWAGLITGGRRLLHGDRGSRPRLPAGFRGLRSAARSDLMLGV